MGFAMKCDRCGLLYEEYEDGAWNYGVQTFCRVCEDNTIKVHDTYDLCPDCMAKFNVWLLKGKHSKDEDKYTQDEEK